MSVTTTKDRQRWQPEEDAILCAYVSQYGPDDWNLISQRVGERLDRDPKSCHERWKNYLKPGIKRGPLTDEEQQLIIKLQAKYGNKWKRIAAEVPGRTAKRLGKWWEVYKERKLKERRKMLGNQHNSVEANEATIAPEVMFISNTPDLRASCGPTLSQTTEAPLTTELEVPVLTLGRSTEAPKWIPKDYIVNGNPEFVPSLSSPSTADSCHANGKTNGGSYCSEPESSNNADDMSVGNSSVNMLLFDLFKELRENREIWIQQKKKIHDKMRQLKKQLECERMEKQRQKMEEIEAKIKGLKEEERVYIRKLEQDYGELALNLERDAELKENKLMEAWTLKYDKLVHHFDQQCSSIHGPLFQAIHSGGIDNIS